MTSRQAFSLISSVIIFNHEFNIYMIIGSVIVFASLFYKSRNSIQNKQGYQQIPQKDPEKMDEEAYGFEINDYRLESDSDHED